MPGEDECEHEMFVTIRRVRKNWPCHVQLKPIQTPQNKRSKPLRIGITGSGWATNSEVSVLARCVMFSSFQCDCGHQSDFV